jgi:glycosyltransferase involved in cell wall biosynthesis
MSNSSQEFPLVSICIPTYNAAAYLVPCLNAALSQRYPNTEILLCDDGSTDETMEIITRFQEKNPSIRLVQNAVNLGMVANWNNCVEQARGEWIKFLFQDDLLEPGCIDEMMEACRQNNVGIAICRRNFILHDDVLPHLKKDFSEGGIIKPEDVFGKQAFISPTDLALAVKSYPLQNILGEPTCLLFHRQLFTTAGPFNRNLKQVVDYEFIVRLGLKEGLAFVSKTLAHFRLHGGSQSSANNQRDKAAQLRNIAADTGDSIALLYQYRYHPAFAKLREVMPAKVLDDYMRQLYYSACKHRGAALVNEALEPIRKALPEIGALKYNFFRYVTYRRRMKKWFRQQKAEGKK